MYSHFSGKAALLVEASKHELAAIATTRLPGEAGVREIAMHWLQPDFAPTRILVAELHCAAIRQPEVAELLGVWQRENAERLERLAGLTPNQVRMYYLLLVGLSHTDQINMLGVTQSRRRTSGRRADQCLVRDPLTGLQAGTCPTATVIP